MKTRNILAKCANVGGDYLVLLNEPSRNFAGETVWTHVLLNPCNSPSHCSCFLYRREVEVVIDAAENTGAGTAVTGIPTTATPILSLLEVAANEDTEEEDVITARIAMITVTSKFKQHQ